MESLNDSNHFLTFGLAPPANPALVVAVPTSKTIGWFNRAPPDDEVSADFPLILKGET